MTLTPTTRPSLLLRLRDPQDHAAWTEFVRLYESVVYRVLRKRGLQDADCRELIQEFFLTVSRNAERWNPDRERGSFRGWLRRVTRNLVVNWLKRRQRTIVGGSGLQELFAETPARADSDSEEFDCELRRAVFHRAAELVQSEVSAQTWSAFWETSMVGSSPIAAGERLAMSPGAVRVAKCRVLKRLREVVAQLENHS